VEDSVAYRGATLNIPVFTKGKSQQPSGDIEETRKLAIVRIHVESYWISETELPNFECNNSLPSEYTRSKRGGPVLLDSIVRVCCALHNVCDIIHDHYCSHSL